jgi:chromosome segregation ATPase|tara:strand:- start:1004 stop:1264 length:261 start_codon:yes stop_codon:yes gene_type:complete
MTENTKDSGYQIETLKAEKVALYEEVRKYRDENEALKKQKEYLQRQCRKAGKAILTLETDKISLNKDVERIQEEYDNYKIIKGNHD